MECFEVIRANEMTSDHARRLVQHSFRDLIDAAEAWGGFIPETDSPDFEIDEQRELSRDRIAELNDQIARSAFDGRVRVQAEALLEYPTEPSRSITPARRLDLMNGVARALVEEQRWFLLRLEDRLQPFIPADPFFSSIPEPAENPAVPVPFDVGSSLKGPTLSEAISDYLAEGKKRWILKTYMARVVQLRYLEEHFGPEARVSTITKHEVRSYRNAISTLRANHGRTPKQSFAAKQTDNVKQRITTKTASLIYEPTRAFFGWAADQEGMIEDNPARKVRFAVEKKPKGAKSRRPFHSSELEKIFTAPIFTGCRSRHRRYETGSEIIKDAKYWLPVLGFYTGARLGELVQLHVGDIVLDAPIPHISINEQNGAAAASGEKKHVKSAAGIRLVPLHPDVIAMGFGEFARAAIKRKRKATDRLFPEFPYGSDGQASTVASKYFRRFLTSIGLTDPAAVFHSFRHGAEDALRNAGQHQYVIDRILGHTDGSTSAGYGEGVDLETTYAAVKAMKLTVRAPQLLGLELSSPLTAGVDP
jgi:integrase